MGGKKERMEGGAEGGREVRKVTVSPLKEGRWGKAEQDLHSGSDPRLTRCAAGWLAKRSHLPPYPGSGGHCTRHRAQVLAERPSQKGHFPGAPPVPAGNSQREIILC